MALSFEIRDSWGSIGLRAFLNHHESGHKSSKSKHFGMAAAVREKRSRKLFDEEGANDGDLTSQRHN